MFRLKRVSKARRQEIEAETARRRADEAAGRDPLTQERRERSEAIHRETMKKRTPSKPFPFGSADWRANEATMRGE